MNKSVVRDAAVKALLSRHPELDGITSFDIEFLTAAPFMCGFDLIIHLHGPDAWKTLQERLGFAGRHADYTTLAKVLDHYCSEEDPTVANFTVAPFVWTLGDGDDGGAVRDEGHTCRLWVRTWWEKA